MKKKSDIVKSVVTYKAELVSGLLDGAVFIGGYATYLHYFNYINSLSNEHEVVHDGDLAISSSDF